MTANTVAHWQFAMPWEIQLMDGAIDGYLIGRILEDYEIILIDQNGVWITKNIEKFVKQIGGQYKNGTWHILLDEYTVMYKGNLLDVSQVVNELIKYGFVRLNGEVIEFRIEEI